MPQPDDWKPVSEGADDWAPVESQTSDVLKSAGSGLVRGVTGAPGIVGDISHAGDTLEDYLLRKGTEWGWMTQDRADEVRKNREARRRDDPNPLARAPDTKEIREKAASVLGRAVTYEPQTDAGRYASAATEMAGNPLSYVGGGSASLARKAAVAGTVGVAGEAGADVARSTLGDDYAEAGRLAGGVLGGAAAARTVRPRQPAPATRDEIAGAASADIDAARALDVPVSRQAAINVASRAVMELRADGLFDSLAPGTYRELGRLGGYMGNTISSTEIYAVRQALNQVRANAGRVGAAHPSDAAAASRAIQHIDRLLDNIPDFSRLTGTHRANWLQARKLDRVSEAVAAAESRSTRGHIPSFDRAMRDEAGRLLRQAREGRIPRWSPEEERMLDAVERGSGIGNLLSWLGRFGHTHNPFSARGITNRVLAETFRGTASRNTRRGMTGLENEIRWAAPASAQRPPPAARSTSWGAATGTVDALSHADDPLADDWQPP